MIDELNKEAKKLEETAQQIKAKYKTALEEANFALANLQGAQADLQQAKEELIKYMEDKGYGEIKDFGSEDPIYANTAVAVAEAVASGEYDRGILICGTGLGVSIAANKVKGAYAALLSDIYSAKRARLSNDANIACMGAFTIGN